MPNDYSINLQVSPFTDTADDLHLADFVHQMDNLRLALSHTEAVVTKGLVGLEWHLGDLSHSSPATVEIDLELPKDDPDFPDHRLDVVTEFGRFWRSLAVDKSVPEEMTRPMLNAFSGIAERVRQGRVRTTLRIGDEEALEVSGDIETLIKSTLSETTTTWGSYEGRLEYVNLHGSNREVRIYPLIGPSKIDCYVPAEAVDRLRDALNREVRVHGRMTYPARSDFPTSIRVEDIEVLPELDELPTIMDIRGIAPDLTNGVPSEVFVRELRDGEE